MSTSKERILAEVHPDEVIALAKDLVRIKSYTTEETPVAEFLQRFLAREGFEARLQEVDPGRFQTLARLPGRGRGRSLMYNGHLDIDPIPSGWVRDPWTPAIEGDRFYGAGIYNMKGGVAAMVMGTVAARRAGVALAGDLLLACVVGELQGGVGTAYLLKSGVRADVAIVPEPYGTQNIITKHTGVLELAVHVVGRSAHISRMEHGINAISKMARVVQALEGLRLRGEPDPDLPGLPRLCVGSIVGGRGREWELRGPNIVPDFCSIFVDVRFPGSMTPESILADILGAVLPQSYAGNDTSHLYRAGIPCCLYGPAGGFDEGASDRWTSVEQIVTCARVFGATIADVCG